MNQNQTMNQALSNDKNKTKNDSARFFARYSGLGFTMLAIILLGTLGGWKLNQWLGFQKPIITVVCALASVVLAIYYVVKDLLHK